VAHNDNAGAPRAHRWQRLSRRSTSSCWASCKQTCCRGGRGALLPLRVFALWLYAVQTAYPLYAIRHRWCRRHDGENSHLAPPGYRMFLPLFVTASPAATRAAHTPKRRGGLFLPSHRPPPRTCQQINQTTSAPARYPLFAQRVAMKNRDWIGMRRLPREKESVSMPPSLTYLFFSTPMHTHHPALYMPLPQSSRAWDNPTTPTVACCINGMTTR